MKKPAMVSSSMRIALVAKAPDTKPGHPNSRRNFGMKPVSRHAWPIVCLVALGISSCSDSLPDPIIPTPLTDTVARDTAKENTAVAADTVPDSLVFAVIGDYGDAGGPARQVSELVKSWNPTFIITLGDNNYERGDLSTIQQNIAQYYCDFIYNPDAPEGYQCEGLAATDKTNRFFPSIGNHDAYSSTSYQPYLSFFTLPGKETYYDFVRDSVHFFVINSSDGDSSQCCDTEQAGWLQQELSQSTSQFNIVYFHHPPYSSSEHGSNGTMQWPFEEWGASAVLTGHDHVYERITRKDSPDFPYIVNGLSGRKGIYPCNNHPLDATVFDSFCYNENYGAIKAILTGDRLTFQFYTIDKPSRLIDEVTLAR